MPASRGVVALGHLHLPEVIESGVDHRSALCSRLTPNGDALFVELGRGGQVALSLNDQPRAPSLSPASPRRMASASSASAWARSEARDSGASAVAVCAGATVARTSASCRMERIGTGSTTLAQHTCDPAIVNRRLRALRLASSGVRVLASSLGSEVSHESQELSPPRRDGLECEDRPIDEVPQRPAIRWGYRAAPLLHVVAWRTLRGSPARGRASGKKNIDGGAAAHGRRGQYEALRGTRRQGHGRSVGKPRSGRPRPAAGP